MVIAVLVGTHELPFDRLVEAAGRLTTLGELRIQRGSSQIPVPGARVVDWLPPSELCAWIAAAEVVITHGGPGTIREVLAAGKVPLVVPRDPAFGEHIDDHQRHFARFLGDRVHRVEDPAALVEAVRAHREIVQSLRRPSVRGEGFAQAFERVVDGLIRR